MELLNKIQKELKVPKSQFNSFAKYNYRNCEDILEAVKPLLGQGTLTLSDEVVEVGGRCYVKATATLSKFTNTVGGQVYKEEVSVSGYAREALDKKGMDEAQITGAASSYARKYALNGLFCIDDTKDADSSDNTVKAKTAANAARIETTLAKISPPKQVGEAQKAEIKALVDAKVLAPITTAGEYAAYVFEQTGLKLEESSYTSIIERLKALK